MTIILDADELERVTGYKSPKDAASYLDDDEKGSAIVRTPGGDQKLTVINESGLYALGLRSRKPEARKLAAVWVDLGKLRARIDGLGILEYDLPPSWWDRQAISG